MLTAIKIRHIYLDVLNDLPRRKLEYILSHETDFLVGAFKCILNYGATEITEQMFHIFYDIVSTKMAETEDFEYEFEEVQYQNLMKLKNYIGICK